MLEQIRLLTKLELCNFYGLNVFRYTKDRKAKKKSIAMAAVFGVVFIVVIGYVCGLCYGLVMLEAAHIIPAYLIAIASVVTLMFSIFKTGSVIFRRQGYDILASMPLSKWAVVISRFLRLYVENLFVMLLVMLPGMVMYGIFVRPSIGFYLIGLLAILITPLVPVAIASGIGALITGISSRMKHKALAEAGLSVLLVILVLLGTSRLPKSNDEITMEMLLNMADMATEAISNLYPPAIWLGEAIVQGDLGKLILLAAGFVLLFGMVVAVVSVNFHGICRRLFSTSAKHDYKMEHLQKSSVLKALVVREARRYFASGIYVSNTIIGPIMGVALSIALLFVDLESMAATLPMSLNIKAAIPFAIAGIFSMMNTTSVSISMEGKEVWILKSLPLDRKTILDGKLLFNICLLAPFYMVSVIVLIIALEPSIWELIGLICIPGIVILFSSVFGITGNLLLPKLAWENEVEVVKQSASAVVGGLGGALIAFACTVLVLLLPAAYKDVVSVVLSVLFVVVTILLYRRNNQGSGE